ncbi:lipopolysaccharide/colanic/teichoic acid biosynthesis glycosyltransferase [Paenibacillus cellulosilyticus]|uniref:Lipopolysaccharide/colanic/teichoic acid biosynthesis glycosyltransferase n=1 Tax=Paenibacillus cellulosilyticus TaxID=375489 RepID=A0A2V2YKZ7_9BACL|nr:sugar transferase [Paenibacillus cellulosilyticus]PWV93818.1 lipopolysaccharide/colanic/teichoic acid biosynthesis glycosyltransferase [Paenibacillus cellulosilyticus]QKS47433.1 sugar transferase [Paenibacillus cellulosilyticus]
MSIGNHSQVDGDLAEVKAFPQSVTSSKAITIPIHGLAKRLMDICLSLLGIIVLIPVFIGIAIIMKIKEPTGPVFFKQKRTGLDSKIFYIIKFRSMVMNAEERLKADKLLYQKYLDNNYKLEQDEDPRITAFGRFLRKSSLDELPQLINVLKGDMSLVGPRPVVREELQEYGERVVDFLSVKPGVTGYWQVSGRSDVGYPERVDLELHYVYNQSIWFDIKILFKTVWTVVLKRGAY